MINKFKSVKSILNKLYRDLDANTELNQSNIIEWVGEAMSMIGAYSQYRNVSANLTISNYRVALPCDFVYLIDISSNSKPMSYQNKSMLSNYLCPDCNTVPHCCTSETFYIHDGWLNTSFETGEICIIYQAVMVDDEGFPMVPDNVYFDKALASYCTYMLDRIAYRKGKLPEKIMRDSERDWYFYVNSARGSANQPSLAELENLKNLWVRLMPLQNEYKSHFSNINNQERKNLQ